MLMLTNRPIQSLEPIFGLKLEDGGEMRFPWDQDTLDHHLRF
jgi:hypothetical protein